MTIPQTFYKLIPITDAPRSYETWASLPAGNHGRRVGSVRLRGCHASKVQSPNSTGDAGDFSVPKNTPNPLHVRNEDVEATRVRSRSELN